MQRIFLVNNTRDGSLELNNNVLFTAVQDNQIVACVKDLGKINLGTYKSNERAKEVYKIYLKSLKVYGHKNNDLLVYFPQDELENSKSKVNIDELDAVLPKVIAQELLNEQINGTSNTESVGLVASIEKKEVENG